MVTYKNLDRCGSFDHLKKIPAIKLSEKLSAQRIASSWISHAAAMSYCYAFAPLDDQIIEKLQALADEQELVEK